MDPTMSLTDRTRSPPSPTDRVFQFISDPRHKENLSGRVRAACKNCRKKKIKCSGELNCATCREKGLVCEGFPDRKRPKRDSMDSCVLDPSPAGVEQVRKLSASKKSGLKQRPGSLLRLANATKSEDSGYGSLSPVTSGPSFERSTATTGVEATTKTSPAPFRVSIWDLGGDSRVEPKNDAVGSSELPPCPSPGKTRTKPLATERKRSDNEISWWNNTNRVDPKSVNLSTAARVVFGDAAQLPPRTKAPKATIDLDGMPFDKPAAPSNPATKDPELANRRQTVQFPTSGSVKPQLDVLENQPGIFDDIALLLAARPSATPGLNDCADWWDLHTDISSMLGQVGEVSKEGARQSVEEAVVPPVEDSPRPRKRPVVGNFYW